MRIELKIQLSTEKSIKNLPTGYGFYAAEATGLVYDANNSELENYTFLQDLVETFISFYATNEVTIVPPQDKIRLFLPILKKCVDLGIDINRAVYYKSSGLELVKWIRGQTS